MRRPIRDMRFVPDRGSLSRLPVGRTFSVLDADVNPAWRRGPECRGRTTPPGMRTSAKAAQMSGALHLRD